MERAVAWLEQGRFPERSDVTGLKIGIQSELALDEHGLHAIDLADLADAYFESTLPHLSEGSRAQGDQDWLAIVAAVERRLGFVLEPELFSNMVFCAHLAKVRDPRIQRMAHGLLRTYRKTDVRGLYHFFVSLRFACDIDCTAVAARGRLALGDIDLGVLPGVVELRRITSRVLASGAVGTVEPGANLSHGKANGELRRNVFKVYLDDHTVQGSELDRGLKNDAVVVLNALHLVLLELRLGLRDPNDLVQLREHVEGEATVRTATASIAEIVAANLAYVTGHLLTGTWREGTRYYASPEVFLFGFADLIAHFPEVGHDFPLATMILEALEDRTNAERCSLDVAFAALTRQRLGELADEEIQLLMERQGDDGAWRDFSPLFQLGTSTPRLYFGSTAQTTAFAVLAMSDEAVVPRPQVDGWFDLVQARWQALGEV